MMKYYFWILGCAMNYSDAERISAIFDTFGFKKTEKENDADIICVISCSVRQHAIDRIFGKNKEWLAAKKQRPLITLLSGCVLEKDRKKLTKAFDFVFEINDLNRLAKFIDNELLHQESQTIVARDYLSVIPRYESSFRAYVPISTGCNNFCTYCAVPYTRGREKSRPTDEVLSEMETLVNKGYKEITLLGQNVNSYGNDLINRTAGKSDNLSFVELLKKIDQISGDYRVYFYSNHPKDMNDELIDILPTLKHFPHYLHFPLQSGNDQVIKDMNRHYDRNKYLSLIKKIKERMPDITLTTDIIVGFPTETEEAFWETAEIMKIAAFDMAFIAQYSPRSGTRAEKLGNPISESSKKEREDILQKILAQTALSNNQKLIGTTEKILVDGEKNDYLYGRTEGYKVVTIKKSPEIVIGDFVDVKIVSATAWKLEGKIA